MTTTTKAMRDLNGYELANLADLGATTVYTDSGKAGYEMLDTIRVSIAEAIENGDLATRDAFEITHEIADSAVPVYTLDIFEALVELRAWGEDISDYEATDLTKAAMECLYIVGCRLAMALVEQYAPETIES